MQVRDGITFAPAAKPLAKKYKSFASDFRALVAELSAHPDMGTSIGKSCRKIRMAITSKGKGKSGGARVIVYVRIVEDRAVLLTIYDKAEKEDLQPGELEALLLANRLP